MINNDQYCIDLYYCCDDKKNKGDTMSLAGPPRELAGPGQNFIRGPYDVLFSNNKTKNLWTVLQSVENTSKRGF